MTGKVQHMRQALSAPAQRLVARIEFAGDLNRVLETPYLIKGWLMRGSTSLLYGAPNTGKSFLAVDIAAHVHRGFSWGGRKVAPSQVLYIAAEGGALFVNRLVAAKAGFMVLRGPFRLGGRNGEGSALASAVRHLAETQGHGIGLVIVDTLARVMGGDENAGPDMSALLADLDPLLACGAHAMLVHHSGKDIDKGARGHSSLRAAIDTEIHLTVDAATKERVATVTKQRDGETGLECRFTLEQVTLGSDGDGDHVTTCVVRHKEGQTLV